MQRRDFSVSDRVVIGFCLMLLALGGVVGVSRYIFGKSAAEQRELTDNILPRAEAAQELEEAVLYVGVGTRGYLLLRTEQTRTAYQEYVATVRDQMALVRSLSVYAQEPQLRQANAATDAFLALADSLVTGNGEFSGQVELALRERREAALIPLRAYAVDQRKKMNSTLAAIRSNRLAIEDSLLLTLVIAVAVAVIVAVVTIVSVRRPTQRLLGIANALQEGNWTTVLQMVHATVPVTDTPRSSRNELTQITRAFGVAGLALREREKQLRTSNSVAASTAASLDPAQISSDVLMATCEYLNAHVGAVYRRAEGVDELTPVATRSLDKPLHPLRLHEGIPGEAAATGHTIVLRNFPVDTPFHLRLGLDDLPPRTVAAVPCVFGKRVVGVLLVASINDFSDADVAFLEATATQLAIGLHNVAAYETVQRLLARVSEQREQIAGQFAQLQSQHEELHSQHEEIQSQNEEIQAQSEEIQAQSEEIQAQNAELQAQASALIQADEHKNDFLGLLAHELRNPMASISNSLVLLEQSEHDSALALRAREIIERQTRQLSRLVDDLLDITRIARGKVRLERTTMDFGSVVRDCVADHAGVAAKAGVTMDCVLPETPLVVNGDRARLLQVVGNLLDNAIKFSSTGGNIRLWVEVDADKSHIFLTVKDDGIGIASDIQPRLFQPFIQADPSHTRTRGGLGLGLSLVRAYVTQHDGSIEVHSDGPGTGSEFTVTLPLAIGSGERSTDNSIPLQAVVADTIKPRRVLLVEDNADGADSLQQVLTLDGHKVCVAADVDAALELAETFDPEVVICDVGLPGTDGYEFARRARPNPKLGKAFLVALTGYASPEDKLRATAAGFDRHLTKPASLQAIRSTFATANSSAVPSV